MKYSSTPLTTVEAAIQHIQSGDVKLGIHSLKSNTKYVYQIREATNGKRFFVNMLATTGEPGFMGVILDGVFQRTDKSRVSEKAPAFIAFEHVFNQLLCNNKMSNQVELYALS